MKRLVLIATLLAASVLNADVMLWQVTADAPVIGNNWGSVGAMPGIVAARLVAEDSAGNQAYQYASIDNSSSSGPIMEAQTFDLTVLPKGPAQLFYIELYSYNDGKAILEAYTDVLTASQLDEFIMADSLMVTNVKAWGGGTFRATPEPTSGLLILFGLAGLALKRRRA